jgi:hypothetical protein
LWFSQARIWLIEWGLRILHRFSPALVLSAFLASLFASFRSRAALQLEIFALRHQLGVLQRSVKKPKLTVLLANPVCGRTRAVGKWSRLEGMWQVGFETAAVCFAPLLALRICHGRAHGCSMLKEAQVEAY